MKLITKVQRRLKLRNGLPEGAKYNDFVRFIRERYVRVYASIKFDILFENNRVYNNTLL